MFNKKKVLDINGLLTLSAINKYQSKRKAAAAMGISVDTINRYIAGLEVSLGTKLIHNAHNGCILTPKAQHIAQTVEDAQNILEAVYKDNNVSQKNGDDYVKIMVPVGLFSSLFFCDADDFYNTYPEIKIMSFCQYIGDYTIDDDVDIVVFTKHPEHFDKMTILFEKDINYGLFASQEYISKHGTPQNIFELCKYHRIVNLIGSEKNTNCWNELIGQSQNICFQSNSAFSLMQAIRNNVGIGLIPEYCKDMGFIRIDKVPCSYKITFYLAVNKKTQNRQKIKIVANYYQKLLEMI